MIDPFDSTYVTSFEEILWGVVLVAITMIIHGVGMVLTLQMGTAFEKRIEKSNSFALGLFVLILGGWLITIVHLTEVFVWASFFVWQGAMPNASVAFYFSLNEYTTLGSDYHLPQRFRLLEGMIATSGLLGFAWSTGTIMVLAKEFQDRQMEIFRQRRAKR
ncbi:MAG: hypothetical protein KDA72_17640 [Planctomycetales bacterium]|nr:hypothetical protein [Planctomycetales bacterium]